MLLVPLMVMPPRKRAHTSPTCQGSFSAAFTSIPLVNQPQVVTHFYGIKIFFKKKNKPYKTKPIHPCRTNPLVTVLPAESCLWLPASASLGNVAPLPTPRDYAGCTGYLTNLTCCSHQQGAPQHGPAELRASTCAQPSREELS